MELDQRILVLRPLSRGAGRWIRLEAGFHSPGDPTYNSCGVCGCFSGMADIGRISHLVGGNSAGRRIFRMAAPVKSLAGALRCCFLARAFGLSHRCANGQIDGARQQPGRGNRIQFLPLWSSPHELRNRTPELSTSGALSSRILVQLICAPFSASASPESLAGPAAKMATRRSTLGLRRCHRPRYARLRMARFAVHGESELA